MQMKILLLFVVQVDFLVEIVTLMIHRFYSLNYSFTHTNTFDTDTQTKFSHPHPPPASYYYYHYQRYRYRLILNVDSIGLFIKQNKNNKEKSIAHANLSN